MIVCSQHINKVLGLPTVNRLEQIGRINTFVDHIIQRPIYDLKQVLKIARSDRFNLNMNEQIEAITVKLKNKYRQCLIVNPLTQYFLESESGKIEQDLIAAEMSMGGNGEGMRGHMEVEEPKKNVIKKEYYV